MCFIFLVLSLSANARTQIYNQPEPSFRELREAYFNHESLTFDEDARLAKKLKTAPYLPTLYVGFDQQLKKTETLTTNDNISLSGGNILIGPEDNNLNVDQNNGRVFRVRAVWNLDEIVFNHESWNLSRDRLSRVNLRSQLSEDLYKIYEQRELCRAQLRYVGSSKAKILAAKHAALTEQLDALTGGVFHQRLHKILRGVSYEK